MSRYYQYKVVKAWREGFAWIPKKTNSNKWVWLEKYYDLYHRHADDGTKCLSSTWYTRHSHNEYLLKVLAGNDQDETCPFN